MPPLWNLFLSMCVLMADEPCALSKECLYCRLKKLLTSQLNSPKAHDSIQCAYYSKELIVKHRTM